MIAAADQVSYEDLYARWERSNWRATEIDFTVDREHWRERFSDFERKAALWNYAMFFHGEDAVADDLSPFIDAAPREEQKYFLATQQVDEARHAVFFHRFLHEVVDTGDGSVGAALEETRSQLTWGFVKTFELLHEVVDRLRKDRSRTALAQAVTMYHLVVESLLAQPGQHFIEDYLKARDVLPGFQAGIRNVSLDEQRHIGFGMKLLRDLASEDPEVPAAVSEQLRAVTPYSLAVFVPPGWDTNYVECFGFTLEQIYEVGARSFEAKLKAAGMPLETLPGPQIMPVEMSAAERSARGLAMLRAGYIGEKNGPAARDPAAMAMLFDMVRRGVDMRRAPAEPLTVQWEFADAEPWHLRLDNGSTAVAAGRASQVDIELRCRFEDWVDVVAGRLDPRRAVATGRLRPRGSPRALWRARGVFSGA
jgi:putative sterol carrier protein